MPRVLISEKVACGVLPSVKPRKLWAGLGSGRPCDGCGRSITPTDLEYELEFADDRTIRLHRDCLAIWHQATGNPF
jgi:hypothetical protein